MAKKSRHKQSQKAGLPPGSLVYIGPPTTDTTVITVFKYNEGAIEENTFADFTLAKQWVQKQSQSLGTQRLWINFDGVHDLKLIEEIGSTFKLHPLTLEDLVNTEQRPRKEFFDDYIYVVVNMLFYRPQPSNLAKEIQREQVSLIIGENFLLSFQEKNREGDVFDVVRAQLRSGKGRIRKFGSDYLGYTLIDAIVDFYFVVLEDIGEKIDVLEEELINRPSRETLVTLYQMKRELLYFRRSAWPLRELVSGLQREETDLLKPETSVFLKDLYDHIIQIIDTLENERERLSSMLDIYLSSVSNKLNEVMKVLTIITTIFMPLSFIAGIYGMNFKHMPELEWTWGYPFALSLMGILAVSMAIYFRVKKWL